MQQKKTMLIPKRIAAIHDLSCIGRCSLTVIMPVLSALRCQVCPLPTALLSTHTGGYDGFTFLDLTQEMKKVADHWDALCEKFDAIYSGFLASSAQIDSVSNFVSKFRGEKTIFLADPVMGDDGEVYKTYTKAMCDKTKELITIADIITPNLTEACILTQTEYKSEFSDDELISMLARLSDHDRVKTVITGVRSHGKVGNVYLGANNTLCGCFYDAIDAVFPGAGDIFASVLLGEYVYGASFEKSIKTASDFTDCAIRYTYEAKTPLREGLLVEALWDKLKR